jgi:hypothetical protein
MPEKLYLAQLMILFIEVGSPNTKTLGFLE